MALIVTDDKNYRDIANSIRSGLGSDIVMKPDEMASQINKISLYKKHYDELLRDFRDIILPDGTSIVCKNMFKDHVNLSAIRFPLNQIELRESSFEGCTRLRTLVLQKILTKNKSNIFKDCAYLRTVFFKDVPDTIPPSMFVGCSGLKNIYVPWRQNQVAGAPWGASTATITYNVNYSTLFRLVIDDELYYDVPLGITWREFIESEYNVDNVFSIDMIDDMVKKYSVKWRGQNLTYLSYTVATYADEAILPGVTYHTV